jgi:hypothetical protein
MVFYKVYVISQTDLPFIILTFMYAFMKYQLKLIIQAQIYFEMMAPLKLC